MHRSSLVLVFAVAACGGSPKQTTTPPPLEGGETGSGEDTKPEAKPEAKDDKAQEPPPPPAGPIDVMVPAPKVTVKLVSPGKGKREAIKVAPKTGDKQPVELALDFAESQTAPPEAPEQIRGTHAQIAPTIFLTGNAEVKSVDANGAAYELAVDSTDVRDVPGQQVPSELIKQLLASMTALKIGGTIGTNGITSDIKLHVDLGDRNAADALNLIRLESMLAWPTLPTEPIGVGAKWQVTSTAKFADKLDVTQTTDYELVKHEGKTWTIKGTSKMSGSDQKIEDTQLSNITGAGTVEIAMADGTLYPAVKAQVTTGFIATLPAPPNRTDIPKTLQVTFELKQGMVVTPNPAPRAPAPVPTPTPAPGR